MREQSSALENVASYIRRFALSELRSTLTSSDPSSDPSTRNHPKMSLRGKTALITGGGKNLGAEIARSLAQEGAHLALHYNSQSSKDETARLKEELLKAHGNLTISIHHGDLTTGAAVEGLFKDAVAEHGKLDIVVNTVGMVLKKPIVEISEAEYDTMFA